MDNMRQTFEQFINQTVYTVDLDLSREVLDELDRAAGVYGLKRSQIADAILRSAFREYGTIVAQHASMLSREET